MAAVANNTISQHLVRWMKFFCRLLEMVSMTISKMKYSLFSLRVPCRSECKPITMKVVENCYDEWRTPRHLFDSMLHIKGLSQQLMPFVSSVSVPIS